MPVGQPLLDTRVTKQPNGTTKLSQKSKHKEREGGGGRERESERERVEQTRDSEQPGIQRYTNSIVSDTDAER